MIEEKIKEIRVEIKHLDEHIRDEDFEENRAKRKKLLREWEKLERKKREEEQQIPKATRHKATVKRIVKKEEKGDLLEHTISYLTNEEVKGNVEIKGKWDAKTRMILDFVAIKFAESAVKLKKEQREFFENRAAIDEYCDEIQKVKNEEPEFFEDFVIRLTVDPSELRKI